MSNIEKTLFDILTIDMGHTINPNLSISNNDLDSLDIAELVLRLEQNYDITIMDSVELCDSFACIVQLVKNAMDKEGMIYE